MGDAAADLVGEAESPMEDLIPDDVEAELAGGDAALDDVSE